MNTRYIIMIWDNFYKIIFYKYNCNFNYKIYFFKKIF